MPKQYKHSSARTRPYKKKAKTSRSSYTGLAVGPKTLTRKLRYATQIAITGGALGAATNVFFRANGCFDPEVAVGGHQPMGFDQYMAMYDHFKVKSSKINVTAVGGDTNAVDSVILSINLDDDATANVVMASMIEQGLTSWAVIASGTNKPTTVSKTFNSADFFSSKKYSAELVGNDAADPVEEALFNVSVAALNSGDTPDATRVLVVIDYIVEFSERTTLAQS